MLNLKDNDLLVLLALKNKRKNYKILYKTIKMKLKFFIYV